MYDFLVFQPVFRLFHDFLLFHLLFSSLLFSSLLFSSLVLSCLVLSCLVLSCLVLSCLVLSCLVLSCLVLSCLVLSFLVLSCLVSPLTCLFFFFSFSSSLSSFLLHLLFHLLFLSFTAHTFTRSTRQVTPPTKNGHAPRDPLNQERAINLSILAVSQPGKFSRVESN